MQLNERETKQNNNNQNEKNLAKSNLHITSVRLPLRYTTYTTNHSHRTYQLIDLDFRRHFHFIVCILISIIQLVLVVFLLFIEYLRDQCICFQSKKYKKKSR